MYETIMKELDIVANWPEAISVAPNQKESYVRDGLYLQNFREEMKEELIPKIKAYAIWIFNAVIKVITFGFRGKFGARPVVTMIRQYCFTVVKYFNRCQDTLDEKQIKAIFTNIHKTMGYEKPDRSEFEQQISSTFFVFRAEVKVALDSKSRQSFATVDFYNEKGRSDKKIRIAIPVQVTNPM